ncbi:MAG: D-glycero-beta-D-manno-heptose 1-phosphate adenylyltransferase [Candidatus Cloacimonetes bacterium]|nr:D-glycero-beta-D-manno-heptose 1-phosphate adenylyltransferase [Candidatus Cloacimonadota bacterium]
MENKILSLPELQQVVTNARKAGKKIVFSNGCFDILHAGHVRYLAEARALGDYLVLGLNSDSSVKRLKGEGRPLNSQEDRALVLAALESVSYICIFHEDTPLKLITAILPDILVKGGDWAPEQIVGAREVLANGGEVKSLGFTEGKSSTNILRKMGHE